MTRTTGATPASSPVIDERYITVADGEIFTWQAGSGPLLLFLHATSMCAAVYRDLLLPLAGNFRVVAPDARGHGRTRLPLPEQVNDWVPFRNDLRHLIAALNERPALLVGHSFGATTVLETAADTPDIAERLVLIDPAFTTFDHADAWRTARDRGEKPLNPLADMAERRRPAFPDIEAARQAYEGRGVFRGWPDSAFEAYLSGGVRTKADGSVHLCCPPAFEALCYRGVSTTCEQSFRRLQTPFTLLAAEHNSPVSLPDEAIVRQMHPEASIARLAGTGHFLPVTHPDQVRGCFPT